MSERHPHTISRQFGKVLSLLVRVSLLLGLLGSVPIMPAREARAQGGSVPSYRVNVGGPTLDMVPDPDFFALQFSDLTTIPGLSVSNVSGETSTTNTIDTSNVDPSLPMALFQTALYRASNSPAMTFDFVVPNGEYNVLLHWAELNFTSAGLRVFDVSVEGVEVLSDYDIYDEAGGRYVAVTEAVLTTVSDGVLNLAITPQHGIALIFGIEIVPMDEPGTIIVEKQTEPDGALDSFEFTGAAPGIIADGGQIVVTDLAPGSYYVQEIVPAGWVLTNIMCDDANSVGDLPNFEAEFQLEAGETVKCTFYNLLELDFGDAPDSYQTLLASDGARHVIISGHSLGPIVDAEPDGRPSGLADGDDINPPGGMDDEDGVILPASVVAGDPAALVTVDGGPSGGMLDAWVDLDGNGAFDHPAEHLWNGTSQVLMAGPNPPLTFAVPMTVAPGLTYARFRLSNAGNLPPFGLAPDGEVEDYQLEIQAQTVTLNYTAGPGGSLTGATSQVVAYGGSGTPVTAVPNTGYRFEDWSDGSTANPRTDTNVTANVNVTANFAQITYDLTVAVDPDGSGTTDPAVGVHNYPEGTEVTVTATPTDGYAFDYWSGACTGTDACVITMDANSIVIAHFVDAAPPDTSITDHPDDPSRSPDAGFSFTSTEPGSTFECRLDGSAFGACVSPLTYTGLSYGIHTFEVRAVDAAGNPDLTPAGYTWTIFRTTFLPMILH